MDVTAALTVYLKDVDLVAETAFLTLTGKMGYGRRLLGLRRFEAWRFLLGVRPEEDPDRVAMSLDDALGAQSTFYNRNKHNYFLECSWRGGARCLGLPLERVRVALKRDVEKAIKRLHYEDSGVQGDAGLLNLKGEKAFLTEVVVEEREDRLREPLSRKISLDMGGRRVVLGARGVLWWLALRASTPAVARSLAEEITVTVRRDQGLLMNPNYQAHAVGQIGELFGE